MLLRARPLALLALLLALLLAAGLRAAPPERPVLVDVAASSQKYDLAKAHLDQPPWASATIYGESVQCLSPAPGQLTDGTLVLPAKTILAVRNARTGFVYEQGRDFTLSPDGTRLVLTADSHIPSLAAAYLYAKPGEPRAVKHKLGDADTWLRYRENGFQDTQVEVDYVPAAAWTGYTPTFAGAQLPRVTAKLAAHQPVTIALIGDSIASGANASSRGYAPHQPPFAILLAAALQARGATITLLNAAVGGATSDGGDVQLDRVLPAKPDLVLIAFGMNDVAGHNPRHYAGKIAQTLAHLHAVAPDTEVILIASSRANPEWNWSPANQFGPYRDALAALVAPGIALADMTALWGDLLARKRYADLAGNGINHPNDYGHRLYAQVLLSLLTPTHPEPQETAP